MRSPSRVSQSDSRRRGDGDGGLSVGGAEIVGGRLIGVGVLIGVGLGVWVVRIGWQRAGDGFR
ncbi:MAG: hypothetical protein OXU51_10610 [Candidatus Poribacteria bacterium]|nr:hypothetical protein [Candidatus Poribacteria bacterium]